MWLDVGCGYQVLSEWKSDDEMSLVRRGKVSVVVDYDLLSLKNHKTFRNRVRADISCLPFRDGAFSLISANVVAEHLAVYPLLAVFELVWIKMLMTEFLRPLRTNIIAKLSKKPGIEREGVCKEILGEADGSNRWHPPDK
jgi:hypothetical protein